MVSEGRVVNAHNLKNGWPNGGHAYSAKVDAAADIRPPGDKRRFQAFAKRQKTMSAARALSPHDEVPNRCVVKGSTRRRVERHLGCGLGSQVEEGLVVEDRPRQALVEQRAECSTDLRPQVFALRPIDEERPTVSNRLNLSAHDMPLWVEREKARPGQENVRL